MLCAPVVLSCRHNVTIRKGWVAAAETPIQQVRVEQDLWNAGKAKALPADKSVRLIRRVMRSFPPDDD